MPFYQSFQIELAEVYLWKITESEDDLLHKVQLSISEKTYLQSVKSSKRKQEWLSIRALWQEKINPASDIFYTPSGSPYLTENNHFISITHNQQFAAFALHHSCTIGIDIENINRDFERIASRYIHEEELANLHHYTRQEQLCLIWCAKEAAFKTIDKKDIDFKNHFRFQLIYDNIFEIHYIKTELQILRGYFYFFENSILALTFL